MPKEIYLWHPIFVHFSVALLSTAAMFFIFAALFRHKQIAKNWVIVGQWNLWVGTLLTILTLLFGWLAFNSVNHDETAHEIMLLHRNLALMTAGGFGALTVWSTWHRKNKLYPSGIFAGLMLICLTLLAMTAFHGGELVYEHGLAVKVLPLQEETKNLSPLPTAAPAKTATEVPEAGTHSHPHHHHHHSH